MITPVLPEERLILSKILPCSPDSCEASLWYDLQAGSRDWCEPNLGHQTSDASTKTQKPKIQSPDPAPSNSER